MNYITRAQWGARAPKWRETIRISKGVFIHYNGGTPLPANVVAGDFNAVCAHLRGVQAYHQNTQGWPDIAYSWCVVNDGNGGALIYELRGWGIAGAHTLGWNWDSHAIYLPLGGNQAPTEAQIAAANIVIAEHNRRFGAGFIKGHQQAPNSTSCPGGPTMARILAGDFRPGPGPVPPPPPPPPPPEPDPEEDEVSKVVVDPRPGRSVWHCAGNTRYRLVNEHEVHEVLVRNKAELVKAKNADDPAEVESILNYLRAHRDLGRPDVKG